MRPLLLVTLGALLLSACSGSPSSPAARPLPSASGGTVTYVALGDSVAAGVGAPTRQRGYVGLVARGLRERLGCAEDAPPGSCPLRVTDLGASGATTGTVLAQQLPRAQEVLRSTSGTRLVTLTVGGNDLFGPVVGACAPDPRSPACDSALGSALTAAGTGVDRVLDGLAAAGGPDTVVALMTYADPVPFCRLAALADLSARALEGDGARPGLNDLLRQRAAERGAVVVDTYPLLRAADDFVGGDDCLHPSAAGHARTAAAFLRTVGDLVVPPPRRADSPT